MAQTFILVRSKFFNISIDKEKKKGHNFEEKRREEKRREEKRREEKIIYFFIEKTSDK